MVQATRRRRPAAERPAHPSGGGDLLKAPATDLPHGTERPGAEGNGTVTPRTAASAATDLAGTRPCRHPEQGRIN
jgi:hypothetical protein